MAIRIGYADNTETITSDQYLAYAAVILLIITFIVLLIRVRSEFLEYLNDIFHLC